MILRSSIEKLMRGENLSSSACQKVLEEMLDPAVNPLQLAAFLVLLRAKQETVEELSAIVNALRDKMIAVPTQHAVLDIVGTGGDGLNSVNISTGSALLAASCGVKVAKHGNRSVSSLTGSADVLEALGVNIQLTPDKVSESINEIGIGFCYSPDFHPVMQALKKFRKALNVPTIFNFLGPLLNPAKAKHLVLGVLNESLLPTMADVLIQTGSGRSVIVYGNGLDEISCVGPTHIIEINGKQKISYMIDPLDFGLSRCSVADLQGGDANRNASILRDAFKGKRSPISDTLILNAAVALYLYGMCSSIAEAVSYVSDKLYSGCVLTLLNHWIAFSYEK
ncbi:MAG TPA: anthranilate phosphoribosyltransferase [Gammaproteobacteria bacterium]|jgi:anthranilate phosphoribosyltransferase|nr:anthranilate phosphoribosyltransferase [Gammaproteobacteria bacterium]